MLHKPRVGRTDRGAPLEEALDGDAGLAAR